MPFVAPSPAPSVPAEAPCKRLAARHLLSTRLGAITAALCSLILIVIVIVVVVVVVVIVVNCAVRKITFAR